MVKRLNWDSDFFGYEVGMIDIDRDFNEREFIGRSTQYKLIYGFSKSKINLNHFKLVDEKAVFTRIIIDETFDDQKRILFNIVEFDPTIHDVDQLRKLALCSGIYSRFFLDKNFINNEYDSLYQTWVDNSINGQLAFTILVALDKENRIIGFTTIGTKSKCLADIGLVAVDENHRGKGLAKALIQSSLEIAMNEGFKTIQVVTQLKNIPAVRLYETTNFEITDITYIYHYWNYDTI